ncbi:hypothetical protein HanIR_Chr11g0516821 [Helianthus annuus]|nr:hypothetical protein HanIR_Chr11g0516821 [Helianthus annuus]
MDFHLKKQIDQYRPVTLLRQSVVALNGEVIHLRIINSVFCLKQFMEVIKLENISHSQVEDMPIPQDIFLL